MQVNADIEILREMIRIAENRRSEELDSVERTNKYNLAIIAFAGSFLSILISTDQSILMVRITGILLILSIISSLIALKPRVIQNGTLTIDVDVEHLRSDKIIELKEYLLETAEYTEIAAQSLSVLAHDKKFWTIISASILALSLLTTYIFYSYA